MKKYTIIETSSHWDPYPTERFVNIPWTTKDNAQEIADVINAAFCKDVSADRYWLVVSTDYVLQRGFEPWRKHIE